MSLENGEVLPLSQPYTNLEQLNELADGQNAPLDCSDSMQSPTANCSGIGDKETYNYDVPENRETGVVEVMTQSDDVKVEIKNGEVEQKEMRSIPYKSPTSWIAGNLHPKPQKNNAINIPAAKRQSENLSVRRSIKAVSLPFIGRPSSANIKSKFAELPNLRTAEVVRGIEASVATHRRISHATIHQTPNLSAKVIPLPKDEHLKDEFQEQPPALQTASNDIICGLSSTHSSVVYGDLSEFAVDESCLERTSESSESLADESDNYLPKDLVIKDNSTPLSPCSISAKRAQRRRNYKKCRKRVVELASEVISLKATLKQLHAENVSRSFLVAREREQNKAVMADVNFLYEMIRQRNSSTPASAVRSRPRLSSSGVAAKAGRDYRLESSPVANVCKTKTEKGDSEAASPSSFANAPPPGKVKDELKLQVQRLIQSAENAKIYEKVDSFKENIAAMELQMGAEQKEHKEFMAEKSRCMADLLNDLEFAKTSVSDLTAEVSLLKCKLSDAVGDAARKSIDYRKCVSNLREELDHVKRERDEYMYRIEAVLAEMEGQQRNLSSSCLPKSWLLAKELARRPRRWVRSHTQPDSSKANLAAKMTSRRDITSTGSDSYRGAISERQREESKWGSASRWTSRYSLDSICDPMIQDASPTRSLLDTPQELKRKFDSTSCKTPPSSNVGASSITSAKGLCCVSQEEYKIMFNKTPAVLCGKVLLIGCSYPYRTGDDVALSGSLGRDILQTPARMHSAEYNLCKIPGVKSDIRKWYELLALKCGWPVGKIRVLTDFMFTPNPSSVNDKDPNQARQVSLLSQKTPKFGISTKRNIERYIDWLVEGILPAQRVILIYCGLGTSRSTTGETISSPVNSNGNNGKYLIPTDAVLFTSSEHCREPVTPSVAKRDLLIPQSHIYNKMSNELQSGARGVLIFDCGFEVPSNATNASAQIVNLPHYNLPSCQNIIGGNEKIPSPMSGTFTNQQRFLDATKSCQTMSCPCGVDLPVFPHTRSENFASEATKLKLSGSEAEPVNWGEQTLRVLSGEVFGLQREESQKFDGKPSGDCKISPPQKSEDKIQVYVAPFVTSHTCEK